MTAFVLTAPDGLTIKDARGFNVAGGLSAKSLPWPLPPTFAGALRTSVGFAASYANGDPRWAELLESATVAGPLAVRRAHEGKWEAVIAAPLDALRMAVQGSRTIEWLKPVQPIAGVGIRACWRPEDMATDGLLRGRPSSLHKPTTMPRWWSREQMLTWLLAPNGTVRDAFPQAPIFRFDLHVGMDAATGAPDPGLLFATETLELRTRDHEFGIYGRTNVSIDTSRRWRFGGEARTAQPSEIAGSDPFGFPGEMVANWAPTNRLRLLLLTPGAFASGWRPDFLISTKDGFAGEWAGLSLTLRAAFVGRPDLASGWDFAAKRSKPSRRIVPAGSVYYFETAELIDAAKAEALWLATLQQHGTQDHRDGFGIVVPGLWPT
jgi:CRISPR-associated protein Cmr3